MVFAFSKSNLSIEGSTVTTLGCDWEKDSFSFRKLANTNPHVRWETNGDKVWLITDCRPTEAKDRVPTTDLYAIAFNLNKYAFTTYVDGVKTKIEREPTEVETYVAQAIAELEPSQMNGAIQFVDIRPMSVQRALDMNSPLQVIQMTPEMPDWKDIPGWWTKDVVFSSYSGGGKGGWTPKPFSEIAEEKLKWFDSLDVEKLEAIEKKSKLLSSATPNFEISAEQVILAILGA